MASRFDIIDETHFEPRGVAFADIDEVLEEMHRLSVIPWDQPPNRAPCMSWRTSGRLWMP
jgi:hypothetical protein